MEKLKSFVKSPAGMVTLVVVIVLVVQAYGSRLPGFGWLKSNVASKLPGAAA